MNNVKEPALVKLGENIRTYRKQLNVSQEELAHLADLDRTYIGGAERGERNLTILSMLRISSALEVSVIDLIDGLDLVFVGEER